MTWPAMSITVCSPAPLSANSVARVWRLSCHRPFTAAFSRTLLYTVLNFVMWRAGSVRWGDLTGVRVTVLRASPGCRSLPRHVLLLCLGVQITDALTGQPRFASSCGVELGHGFLFLAHGTIRLAEEVMAHVVGWIHLDGALEVNSCDCWVIAFQEHLAQ